MSSKVYSGYERKLYTQFNQCFPFNTVIAGCYKIEFMDENGIDYSTHGATHDGDTKKDLFEWALDDIEEGFDVDIETINITGVSYEGIDNDELEAFANDHSMFGLEACRHGISLDDNGFSLMN